MMSREIYRTVRRIHGHTAIASNAIARCSVMWVHWVDNNPYQTHAGKLLLRVLKKHGLLPPKAMRLPAAPIPNGVPAFTLTNSGEVRAFSYKLADYSVSARALMPSVERVAKLHDKLPSGWFRSARTHKLGSFLGTYVFPEWKGSDKLRDVVNDFNAELTNSTKTEIIVVETYDQLLEAFQLKGYGSCMNIPASSHVGHRMDIYKEEKRWNAEMYLYHPGLRVVYAKRISDGTCRARAIIGTDNKYDIVRGTGAEAAYLRNWLEQEGIEHSKYGTDPKLWDVPFTMPTLKWRGCVYYSLPFYDRYAAGAHVFLSPDKSQVRFVKADDVKYRPAGWTRVSNAPNPYLSKGWVRVAQT